MSPTAIIRRLLWKDDGAKLPGLGQAWSTPVITRVNINGATQNSQRLVLVIGGGYDAMEDNSTYYAADTVGNHIYMVDAISGNLLWSAGKTGGQLQQRQHDPRDPEPGGGAGHRRQRLRRIACTWATWPRRSGALTSPTATRRRAWWPAE